MGYNSVADIMGLCPSIFIYLSVVASQNREITRKSDKIWPYSSSGSSKIIDLGVSGKPIIMWLCLSLL